jgi:SAM-dependent methyltransferase
VDLRGWDERHRSQSDSGPPTPLVVDIAGELKPGRALDLACGAGRNAEWLAEHGWRVTAIDGSPAAVDLITTRNPEIEARVADLEKHEYIVEPNSWDLITICYYLQRDLFEPAKRGVVRGGVVIAIVHIPGPGEGLTRFRLAPGELAAYFGDFEILHCFEGPPRDPVHHMRVSEIAARRIE